MRRALDEAKALNEDLGGMGRDARALVAELNRIAWALRTHEEPDEPHWLDEMAREIGEGRPPREDPVFNQTALAAMDINCS